MISVIVPIYKVEQYLAKCIESLISQTYHDLEVILVDDGSPDGCPAICDKYAKKDSRIVVIHQKNSGVSAARNAGLSAAHGEYIGFVDPDDWVAHEMYQDMVEAIDREQVDMAICGYEYYDELGRVDEKRRYLICPNEVVSQKVVMQRFADMPPTIRHGVWNKLFKKSIVQNIRFVEGLHSSEDVFFLCEAVLHINKAIIIHKPHYMNLVRAGSATHGGLNINSLADSIQAHDRMYSDTIRLYPELKNHAQAFLLDVCTLKYNEAKRKAQNLPSEQKSIVVPRINEMRRYIIKNAWQALLNPEIYWKTRIAYLIME